jgi:hypothetical protein
MLMWEKRVILLILPTKVNSQSLESRHITNANQSHQGANQAEFNTDTKVIFSFNNFLLLFVLMLNNIGIGKGIYSCCRQFVSDDFAAAIVDVLTPAFETLFFISHSIDSNLIWSLLRIYIWSIFIWWLWVDGINVNIVLKFILFFIVSGSL